MISVIIPTYKEPEYLDLCIRSAIEGQRDSNEIIVVDDSGADINRHVISKYKGSIVPIIFESNQGLSTAINIGVLNAKNDDILIVNDDNVFPKEWDYILSPIDNEIGIVASPTQIEPMPSIFKSFVCNDLGRDPRTFDLLNFWGVEKSLRVQHDVDDAFYELETNADGGTLPVFMNKKDFNMVGGWDALYDSPYVVDWDFFYKLQLAGCKVCKIPHMFFYHFGGIATHNTDFNTKRQELERSGHLFFAKKWGFVAQRDINNHIYEQKI